MRNLLRLAALALLLLPPTEAPADSIAEFSSGKTTVALLELFSSEGCSSCPPADEFLSGLRGRADLWKAFIPVGFHVDYWDRLGWVDKLAQKAFTRRQHGYAAQWKSDRVYTPALVFQGKEWSGWQRGAIPTAKGEPGSLRLTLRKDGSGEVSFRPQGSPASQVWSLSVAVLGNGVVSKILAGENRGKTIRHEFVVMDFHSGDGFTAKDGKVTMNVSLKPSPKVDVPRYSAVAWAVPAKAYEPVQAVGGDLPESFFR